MSADEKPSKALAIAAAVLLALSAVPLGGAMVSTPADSDGATASGTASGSGSDSDSNDAGNVSRVFVEPRYERVELEPGEAETLTVTVVNDDDHAVQLRPQVVRPRRARYRLQDDWVSVDLPSATLEPGAEVEATVTVAVPEDAELGDYRGELAFTNETVQYGDAPPRHVHALDLGVEVYEEPTLYVRSGRHLHSQVKAGGSYTHEIVVQNTGDEAVSLSPAVKTGEGRSHCYGPHCPAELDRSWLSIQAPPEVPARGNATVEVTVAPPADAQRGRYDAEVTLGLDDPNRPRGDRYWQEIGLDFQVWKQPEEPFEKSFAVRETDDGVTVQLSAGDYRRMENREPASFDVAFVAPNGTLVEAERVRTTNRGHVDLGGRPERSGANRDYRVRGGHRQFRYELPVDDPAAGEWTLRVTPNNTVQFGYEIVRNASGA